MIKIFKKDETNFSHDGLEVLDDIVISSYTEWSEESKWIIQAKFKKDFDKSESIKEGLIIQVPTEKGDQLFRILKINKKNRKYISISGHAIGYDFNDNFIQDINIVEKSGRVAMQQISNGTVYPHRYNLTSNIDRVASARVVRKNGMEALINTDKDNTFVERWGGCLVLDNFNISMNEAVGQDRGVEISIGKNITGYDGDIDEETVCTGINAITYDGLTLPEGVYYSPLVNNYPHPKIREFKFDDIKYKYSENNYDKEGYETLDEVYAAIRKACDDLFNTQNIDKPTCSLRVNIAALENTDQYKGDELNERIFQGDILTANLEDYGFNVKLKMVANRYDNIRNRYIDIDLGDAKNNLFKDIGKIEVVIDKVVEQLGGNTWQDILDKSMQEAADLIAAGIKDSYVVARKNEILIMDSPQVESAINVIRMNKNGIAFSQNGYNGPYTLAITIDGKINASCITTGQLNAALIKTGMLMSANGTTWIDMENGTFNFANKINFDGANFAVDLSGKGLATDTSVDNKLTFKVSKGEEFSTELRQNANEFDFVIGNDGTGVKIDKNGARIKNGGLAIANNKGQDVFAADPFGNMNMNMYGTKFTISATGDRKTEMWCDYYDKFILQVPYTRVDGGIWIKRDTGATILSDLVTQNNDHYKVYVADFHSPSAKIANLYVTGTKNCLQATKTYGERLINAYETAEYFFGDIGSGVIKDGQCIVAIDDILQECVNTNIQYHVFTQIYKGSITKIERYQTYFIVYGSDNTEFSWELKAKRIGYENNRFDIVDDNNPERIDDFHFILDEGQYEDKYKIIEVENVLDSNPETSDISSILLEDVFLLENVLLGGI